MKSPERKSQSIPDEDVAGWLKTLAEAGFDGAEIDRIMVQNDEYKIQKMPSYIRDSINQAMTIFQKERGRPMNSEERKKFLAMTVKLLDMSQRDRDKWLATFMLHLKDPDLRGPERPR